MTPKVESSPDRPVEGSELKRARRGEGEVSEKQTRRKKVKKDEGERTTGGEHGNPS